MGKKNGNYSSQIRGRPSTWASAPKFEDTKLVRVPAKIAAKVLRIAHALDRQESLEIEDLKISTLDKLAIKKEDDGYDQVSMALDLFIAHLLK